AGCSVVWILPCHPVTPSPFQSLNQFVRWSTQVVQSRQESVAPLAVYIASGSAQYLSWSALDLGSPMTPTPGMTPALKLMALEWPSVRLALSLPPWRIARLLV